MRLNGLALLYVHRDISLDFKQVIAEFSRKNRRQLQLIFEDFSWNIILVLCTVVDGAGFSFCFVQHFCFYFDL